VCRVRRPDREGPSPLRQAKGTQFNDLIVLRCYQQRSLSKKVNSSNSSSKMGAKLHIQFRIISKINHPACALLDSFGSDSLGTVITRSEAPGCGRLFNDALRMEYTLGRTEFSSCMGPGGPVELVEIPNHFASNMRAAIDVLGSHRVDLVLSHAYLSDGTGFGLLESLTYLPVITTFLCLPVENSCLWLPAIDGGKKCLGLPALRPSKFAGALEEMARCLSTRTQAPCLRLDALFAVDRECV
jgi:hypothetical protein